MAFGRTNASGGVTAGTWRFAAATALPAEVSKRTMLAVCETLPTTIVVSDAEPTSPAENDIWFHVSNPENGRAMSDGSVPIKCWGAYAWHAAAESASGSTTIASGTVTVAAASFRTAVNGRACRKLFRFNGSDWKLDGVTVTLADYGISITAGSAASGDTITVAYVSGWELLTAYYSYLETWCALPGLPASGTSLAACSWEQIGRICAAGKAADYFCVGDEKEIALTTTEVVTLQIIGMGHDDLAAAGGGKAPITFAFKSCLNTAQSMNATNTNVNGYSGCALYSTINGAIYESLPAELRAVMKEVNKLTSAGNQSVTIVTTQEKLFMLSEVEVLGSVINSKAGEGTQYPFFTNGGTRVKAVSGTASIWWTRSPTSSYATAFCNVDTSGAAGTGFASAVNGVVLALCV